MVENITVPLPFQVKERMVRQVTQSRRVGSGKIFHTELILRGKHIAHADIQVTREPVLSISKDSVEEDSVFRDRVNVPNNPVDTELSTVQGVPVIVLKRLKHLSVY